MLTRAAALNYRKGEDDGSRGRGRRGLQKRMFGGLRKRQWQAEVEIGKIEGVRGQE
jgi:hypothetical protein